MTTPKHPDIDAALEHLTKATLLLHADAFNEGREHIKEACRKLDITLLDDIFEPMKAQREAQAAAQLNADLYSNLQYPRQQKTATEIQMKHEEANRRMRTLLDGMQPIKPSVLFNPEV